MNEIRRFRREVKRQLRCSGKKKRELMVELDGMLQLVQIDHAAISRESLFHDIGTPHEVADTLISKIEPSQYKRYSGRIQLSIICLSLIITALLAISAYLIWFRITPIHVEDRVVIYEKSYPLDSNSFHTETTNSVIEGQ